VKPLPKPMPGYVPTMLTNLLGYFHAAAAAAVLLMRVLIDIQTSGDLPDHMSPYVFFVVFNDTTFISYNSNETSHVKISLLLSLSFCCRFFTVHL